MLMYFAKTDPQGNTLRVGWQVLTDIKDVRNVQSTMFYSGINYVIWYCNFV